MGIVSWLILGLLAGAIATAMHRGTGPRELPSTLRAGVLGALLGR